MVFVKARGGTPNVGDPSSQFTVQYFDEEGNMTIRSGGKRAWRCNNPGNLIASPYSKSKDRGCIGTVTDGSTEYSIYPDYKTGHETLIVMLRGSVYSPLTLRAAMKKYDSSNPKYIDTVVKITKLDPERTIKSLSNEEFELFWKAIEQTEKWEVGNEEFIEKWIISGVHKKHKVITEYLVHKKTDSVWVSKPEALQLALQGRLHAILVHLKTGTLYLRPEFGSHSFAVQA
jgi:hypothetical protein